MVSSSPLDALRPKIARVAEQAYVPYSNRPAAAGLLLADGRWVPGVRVESAAFSLVIPALLNAHTTAVAGGRSDVIAVVLDHPARREEDAFLHALPETVFRQVADDGYVAADASSLPDLNERFSPFLQIAPSASPEACLLRAREVARRAYVPESNFPVGCVLVTQEGTSVPGVNVEHEDWTRILCAERNALGTAVTYDLAPYQTLYLACPNDPKGTPCGACRQLLVELASDATLWMDRPDRESSESATPKELLPGGFTGQALRHAIP